ncbi:S4 domain-containing protein [Acetobacter pasteurianus]|uniref:RNA-binding S4 domain-containing protein n=1 Tax=Acetobacter pasteurianus subsp. pasteurianus TaxID=481145 RepID=A0A1Y0XW07_ACEPA|nr:hypothetical protein S1001342_00711 [Acetobacter pasteurianus subsp. pasteurianus]
MNHNQSSKPKPSPCQPESFRASFALFSLIPIYAPQFCRTNGEARRLVRGGALEVNGKPAVDENMPVSAGDTVVVCPRSKTRRFEFTVREAGPDRDMRRAELIAGNKGESQPAPQTNETVALPLATARLAYMEIFAVIDRLSCQLPHIECEEAQIKAQERLNRLYDLHDQLEAVVGFYGLSSDERGR